MKFFITGAAGFIGSNMVDHLLSLNHEVVGYDNFSTGQRLFLKTALENPNFKLIEGDCLDVNSLSSSAQGCKFVFHFAANADVRHGLKNPKRDLEQNTFATFNVLEAMRVNNIKNIAFSSTGSIYGEANEFPTPENTSFPIQTSLYGASKLACEGLIAAYCEGYDMKSWIFRFVSILGERYTHGHVFDFAKKLKQNALEMEVLGDGTQKKSYLYIDDCLKAIMIAIEKSKDKVNIFNLGTDEYCEVNDSINWITKHLGVSPKLNYTGGSRGWIGDNPFIFLDCKKIRSLDWIPTLTIKESVIKTIDWIMENKFILDARK